LTPAMTRIGKIVATAASITLMLVVTASSAAALEELRSANVAEVRDGYRISWLQGHSVINDQNEMIGTISEFVVGRDLAIFAILQVGGFIGLRTHLVAVPFKTLVIDEARLRVRLPGATRKALENFPQFRFSG
jgi:hypothetical protein